MAKGDGETMEPPMPRSLRSRKRGYTVDNMTEDEHHVLNIGEVDKLQQCVESPVEDGGQKCNTPFKSSPPVSDQLSNEKIGHPEMPEVAQCDPKRQLVISLADCGLVNKHNDIEKVNKKPDECGTSDKHTDINSGINPDVSEEQTCTEDNPDHKMDTNQGEGEVRQMSKDSVVEGSAKKRRRMGMCQLSEKERSQFLFKSNRVESGVKHQNSTDWTKDENGPSAMVMSPHQETTEIMREDDIKPKANQEDMGNRGEPRVKPAGAHRTTMMCEQEMHISEEDRKEDTKVMKLPGEKKNPRIESGCQKTIPDAAVTVFESGQNLCEDSKQTLQIHPSAEELTRSETEVHVTLSLPHVDTVCESQNPKPKTIEVQEEGPPGPDQTVALSNVNENKHLNEQEETEMYKQDVESISADGHVNFNINTNSPEDPAKELASCLLETETDTTVEIQDQADDPDLSHSSFSGTAADPKSISMGFGHAMNGTCEKNEHPDSPTATMGPPWPENFSDQSEPCGLDYVSDSQLNTIVLTEQAMAAESGVCPEHYEEGTDLIRGLIRELSALNRTVMAAHRELENVRRRGKNTREII